MRWSSVASCIVGLALALGSTGCTSLEYVTQAAAGEEDLQVRARDIDLLVAGKHVDARTRGLLGAIPIIKRFGEGHGLKATTNYTKYVRVDGPAVVWVVSASEPLRFRSKEWSFPLVGSFTYLGWFKRSDADAFAGELRARGWDVDVRGADAYSTQGYFEDPVLSSMIAPGEDALGELANVILHESAHATFFVRNQSTLNESVAEFVGDRLADEFLARTRGATSEETRAYEEATRRSIARKRAMRAAYVELAALYDDASIGEAEKLARKRAILARLAGEVHARRPINNATLIQYRTYDSGQGELGELLEACGGDWGRFVGALKTLEGAPLPRAQESDVGALVKPLVDAGCGAPRAIPSNEATRAPARTGG